MSYMILHFGCGLIVAAARALPPQMNQNLFRRTSFSFSHLAALVASLILGVTITAQAQLGTGWTQYSPTKNVHLDDENGLQIFTWSSYRSVGSGSICADYKYDSATDTETFRLLDDRTNRAEIRLENEYSTGNRQLQGYVTFNSPLNDESLTQIFGSSSGATLVMTRGYSGSSGKIMTTNTGGRVTGS